MKKCVFFLCIYFSTSSVFATIFCLHTINVNNNFSIFIEFQDNLKSEVTDGLYFDLIVWAKNVENELSNFNGSISIDYMRDYQSIIMWISKKDTADIAYRFSYDTDKKGIKIVEYTNINTGYTHDFIIKEESFLPETKELTKAIIMILNANFQINGCCKKLNTIELFVKNNKENIAKSEYEQKKIHSDYIYINKEELLKSIENQPYYFIETIKISRKKVNKMVEVDRGGCG